MIWWLRSRRWGTLGAAAVVELMLVYLLGGELLPTPSLADRAIGRVPAIVFLPLIVSSAVQFSLEGRDPSLDGGAVRRVSRLDAALVAMLLALTASASALLHAAGAAFAAEAARNTVGYVGLGLVVRALAGERAGAVVPAAYVVLLALAGGGAPGPSSAWAWPIQEIASDVALSVAGVLGAIGLLATAANIGGPSATGAGRKLPGLRSRAALPRGRARARAGA